MALSRRDQRHPYLRFKGLEYSEGDIADFEERLGKIFGRGVHRVQVLDFGGLTDEMDLGLSGRMLIEHRDNQGQSVFTSRPWRWLFKIRGPLVHEFILEFFSTFRFGETVLDLGTVRVLQFQLGRAKRRKSWRQFVLGMGLHTAYEMESAGFGTYWDKSARQIPDKGDLSTYWRGISSEGDFLGSAPSYTAMRDPMLRLYHRSITCNIARRSQHLRRFTSGRKRRALISGGQFICEELDDTWAWVVPGLERKPNAAAGALEVAKDALDVDEGAQAIPAPVQAPQPPPAAAQSWTMP
ncbi:hypothetical protein Tco_0697830 [Tanacetum coccineum]